MSAHLRTPLSSIAPEAFVANADLTDYDLSGFKPMRFEIEPKTAALNMRLSESLLEAVKVKAAYRDVSYTRYVRMLSAGDVTVVSFA